LQTKNHEALSHYIKHISNTQSKFTKISTCQHALKDEIQKDTDSINCFQWCFKLHCSMTFGLFLVVFCYISTHNSSCRNKDELLKTATHFVLGGKQYLPAALNVSLSLAQLTL
jgi:uncharacterized membrane protein